MKINKVFFFFYFRYLCEFTYYTSLNINKNTIFVHVPPIDQPYSASEMAKALAIVISSCLKQIAKSWCFSCIFSLRCLWKMFLIISEVIITLLKLYLYYIKIFYKSVNNIFKKSKSLFILHRQTETFLYTLLVKLTSILYMREDCSAFFILLHFLQGLRKWVLLADLWSNGNVSYQ